MDTEEIESLTAKRKALKGVLTRKQNEMSDLMNDCGNIEEVRGKQKETDIAFNNFWKCHRSLHVLFTEEDDLQSSQEYLDTVEKNHCDARRMSTSWALQSEIENQKAVQPHDSVSRTSSGSRVSASIADSHAKAAVKKAQLLAQRETLLELQNIEMEQAKLEHKKSRLQLDTEIKIVEAEEKVYAASEVSVKSHTSTRNVVHVLDNTEEKVCDKDMGASYMPKLIDALQLPKSDLMQFSGDPLTYWIFIRSFENCVEKNTLDDNARLTRLMQYCTGKARRVIQCCSVMPPKEGYAKARRFLKERFGDDYLISEAWIRKIIQGQNIKSNDKIGLQEYSDELQSAKETLTAMGRVAEIDTQRSLVSIVQRLPMYLQGRWRKYAADKRRKTDTYPNIEDLVQFVVNASDEANDPVFGVTVFSDTTQKDKAFIKRGTEPFKRSNFSTAASQKEDNPSYTSICPLCSDNHTLFGCSKFKDMGVWDRYGFVRDNRLCHNCLKPNHIAMNCRKPSVCSVAGCGQKHTKFIHLGRVNDATNTSHEVRRQSSHQQSGSCNAIGAGTVRTALPIVPVMVKAPGMSKVIETYALLDAGSTNTFCSDDLVSLLGLKGKKETLFVTTLEKTASPMETHVVSLEIADIEGQNVIELPIVYSKSQLPVDLNNIAKKEDIAKWPHLNGIQLPDIEHKRVTILIGQDVPEALIPLEVRQREKGEPFAIKTQLGWTINGPLGKTKGQRVHVNFVQSDNALSSQVERFWKMDTSDTILDDRSMSVNDKIAMQKWDDTVRLVDGHYEIAIPFKHGRPFMPGNRHIAEHRLYLLGKRFSKEPELFAKYKDGVSDLLEKGYAESVPDDQHDINTNVWYLPHHPVMNVNKPGKVRIVFDCAQKYQGASLNDQVLQGPDMMNKLVGVLLRFRQHPIAMMGDIESMFHQVKVRPPDRDVLRFLWWQDSDMALQPKMCRMTAHLFGGIWSPCWAINALKATALDNQNDFSPEVVNTVLNNFYVDDCLKSVESVDSAVSLVQDLCKLLRRGGFRLTKWTSNNREVLMTIPNEDKTKSIMDLDLENQLLPVDRALGVQWNVEKDLLELKISPKDKPLTRHGVISIISSVYDPLGLVSPCILRGKQIFQELCRLKLGWDDPLPEPQLTQWLHWVNELPKLRQVATDRCFKSPEIQPPLRYQLHHFSDASQSGYGAASYIRMIDTNGKVHCALLMSKARLAPLKMMSIPRLELSAAVVSIKLDGLLHRELELPLEESVFWTDSTLVIAYVKNETRRFSTFVGNRISVIHEGSQPKQWRHVPTDVNPADVVSRGSSADEFISGQKMQHAPDFLWSHEEVWPVFPGTLKGIDDDDPEIKRSIQVYSSAQAEKENSSIDSLFQRYSSWNQLVRAVSWLLRFRKILLDRQKNIQPLPKYNLPLTVIEMKSAVTAIVKNIQQSYFCNELKALKAEKCVNRASSISSLDPMVSDAGLLCVGGRLRNAPMRESIKHQMILPKDHSVSIILIRHHHEMCEHSGREYVLAKVRERFWIVGARSTIKRVLSNCVHCRRFKSKPGQQKMADLPYDRVAPGHPPFTYVGVDCFGPFFVQRGRSSVKRYGCLFTCLVMRAVHIEVLHSMDTDAFLNALQRFIARRGCPIKIRSDNGTNFTGADRELRQSIREWNRDKIDRHMTRCEIQWEFNPPSASHMGGVWERQIRTVRQVLTSVLKEQSLSDEGLSTMMCIAESIVNSRPLTPNSDDPKDNEPLTPNHLLLLRGGELIPPGVFVERDIYRRRWRQIQYLANVFWKRWSNEYIHELQRRQKWLKTSRNLQEGDVVLVPDESAPRGMWPLGLVVQTVVAKDGLVRTVMVKTRSSVLTRPITKLVLLETVN